MLDVPSHHGRLCNVNSLKTSDISLDDKEKLIDWFSLVDEKRQFKSSHSSEVIAGWRCRCWDKNASEKNLEFFTDWMNKWKVPTTKTFRASKNRKSILKTHFGAFQSISFFGCVYFWKSQIGKYWFCQWSVRLIYC